MSQAHKNRITAKKERLAFEKERSALNKSIEDYESEVRMAKKSELAIREKLGSAGSTPINVYPPTQGGIRFYQIGRDPSASARGANVRANKARGTQSSATRVPVK